MSAEQEGFVNRPDYNNPQTLPRALRNLSYRLGLKRPVSDIHEFLYHLGKPTGSRRERVFKEQIRALVSWEWTTDDFVDTLKSGVPPIGKATTPGDIDAMMVGQEVARAIYENRLAIAEAPDIQTRCTEILFIAIDHHLRNQR